MNRRRETWDMSVLESDLRRKKTITFSAIIYHIICIFFWIESAAPCVKLNERSFPDEFSNFLLWRSWYLLQIDGVQRGRIHGGAVITMLHLFRNHGLIVFRPICVLLAKIGFSRWMRIRHETRPVLHEVYMNISLGLLDSVFCYSFSNTRRR